MQVYVDRPVNNLLFFCVFLLCFFFLFRYHCHTLPPVSPRAVGTVTQSKVLWIGIQVPSCQPTNCQVSGTLPTPTEGNTATTTLLHTRNKVCHQRAEENYRKQLMAVTEITENITNPNFRLCCEFKSCEMGTNWVWIWARRLACELSYLAMIVWYIFRHFVQAILCDGLEEQRTKAYNASLFEVLRAQHH